MSVATDEAVKPKKSPFDFEDPLVSARAATEEIPEVEDPVDRAERESAVRAETEATQMRESALAAGLTEEEIDALAETPAVLRSTVAVLTRVREAHAADETGGGSTNAGESQGSVSDEDAELDATIAALDPEKSESPELATLVKKLYGRLKGTGKTPAPAKPAAAGASSAGEADILIGGLGAEFAEVFGKLPANKLPAGSKHLAARTAVVKQMASITESARTAGRTVPNSEAAFDIAIRTLYPDRVKKAERARQSTVAETRSTQAIGRPGGSRREMPLGKERARAAVRSEMASKGMPVQPRDTF